MRDYVLRFSKKYTRITWHRFFCMAKNYFHAALEELQRVSWPTRAQAVKIVSLTIVMVIISAITFGFTDHLLSLGYKALVFISNG